MFLRHLKIYTINEPAWSGRSAI